MQWSELSPAEKYRVVELAESGKTPVAELCATFGVSRQTLHAAREKVRAAAVAALAPQPPGRKPRSVATAELVALKAAQAKTQAEAAHWQQRYEAAKTFLELERKLARGEPLPGETPGAEKKTSRRERREQARRQAKAARRAAATRLPLPGPDGGLGGGDHGSGDGHDSQVPAPLDGQTDRDA